MITCSKFKYLILSITILLIAGGLLLTGCGSTASAKTYTIGVVNYTQVLNPIVEGFQAGMAKLGYTEGKNVTYIYHGALENDPQVIEAEVKALLDQKVDMFLTLGTPTTLAAKKAVEGTNIPVIFVPVVNPVEAGVVANLRRPGGNVTGIQSVNLANKGLEWLLKITPETKKVYTFYHPGDEVSVTTLKPLPEAASVLGVEFVPAEVHSPEEMLGVMQTLPKNTAILLVTTPSLEAGIAPALQLAAERGILVGGYNRSEETLVLNYTADRSAQGKQAARLADQVLKGIKPADLPVESPEFLLTINLKTAQTIGLDISDEILRQADKIIR